MSANNIDLQMLKLLAGNSQANLAKFGGYAPQGGWAAKHPKASGALNIAAQGLGALFGNAPLGQAITGINNAVNVGRYNKSQQQQAEAARQYQILTEALKAGDRSEYVKNSTGLDVSGYGDAPTAELIQGIQQANQNPNINALLNGQPLQQAQYGAYDPKLTQDYLNRGAAVSDAQAYQNQQVPNFQGGQNAAGSGPSFLGGKIGQALTQQMQNGMRPDAGLDSPPMLNAGVTQQEVIPPAVSPYAQGIVDPTILNGLFNKGVDNTQERGKQTETNRHNVKTEQNDAFQNQSGRISANADMLRAKKYQPGGGGGYPPQPNEATRAYDALQKGLITPEQYAQTLGVKAPGATFDPTRTELQQNIKNAVDVYGAKSPEAQAAYRELQGYQGGQAFKKSSTPNVSQLFNLGNPFGGSSNANLKNVGKNLGAQYGVRY